LLLPQSRASGSGHIAEGANRIHPRDKAARFTLFLVCGRPNPPTWARAECGECEAAIEMSRIVGLVPDDQASLLRQLADRVAAMAMGLVRREMRRVRAEPVTRIRDLP